MCHVSDMIVLMGSTGLGGKGDECWVSKIIHIAAFHAMAENCYVRSNEITNGFDSEVLFEKEMSEINLVEEQIQKRCCALGSNSYLGARSLRKILHVISASSTL
jgi:hypothetical protein